MNPYQAGLKIQKSIVDNMHFFYPLLDAFNGHPDGKEFKKVVDGFKYVSSPYLERIPFYSKDESTTLASLRDYLHPRTIELFSAYWTGNINKADQVYLYEHQSCAIREFYDDPVQDKQGKNLLVCTGTGSGKTETFLIPLLDAIIRAKERKEENGIKAMLLYPMNALVNDQIRRLREILRCAEKFDIPLARDVTFGQYTGNVVTETAERYNLNTNRANFKQQRTHLASLLKEVRELSEGSITHPYFDSDAYIKNEYRSRARWNDCPADILITNYAMLERLLLDPCKDDFFDKGSWRYIILDEAHSYDGALGTEIAWLLRRLLQRTSSNNRERRQFIATSATMGAIDDARKFVAGLFRAEENTFVVLEGRVLLGADPRSSSHEIRDISYVSFVQDNCVLLQPIRDKIKKCKLAASLQPSKEQNVHLLGLTQWVSGFENWLKQFSELSEIKDTLINKPMALGDFLAYARLLERLYKGDNSNTEVSFHFSKPFSSGFSAIVSIMRKLLKPKSEFVKRSIADCAGSPNDEVVASQYQDLCAAFPDGGANEIVLRPELFIIVSYIVSSCYEYLVNPAPSREGEACNRPLRWSLTLCKSNFDLLMNARCRVADMAEMVREIKGDLVKVWQRVTGSSEQSVPAIVTDYIASRPHFKKLEDCFAKISHPTWEQVQAEIGIDGDEMNAFLNLLPLSLHPIKCLNKPLCDLRFHQAVSGISSVAVYFENPEKACFVVNDERSLIDGHPTYTLGYCRSCAQPYLIGYRYSPTNVNGAMPRRTPRGRRVLTLGENRNPRLFRYDDFDEAQLVALQWVPPSEEAKPECMLNIETGELIPGFDAPNDNNNCVKIYRILESSNDADGNTNPTFASCPCCGGKAHGGMGVENMGALDVFKTGSSILRNIALYQLSCQADEEFGEFDSSACGRKVLAFSDSRNGAASVAVSFEWFEETRILNTLVRDAVREITASRVKAENYDAEIASYEESLQQATDERYREYLRKTLEELKKKAKEASSPFCTLEEIRENVKKKMVQLKFHSFLAIPYYEERPVGGRTRKEMRTFDADRSATLAVLSSLRRKGRNTLLSKNLVEVISMSQMSAEESDSVDWKNWCCCFASLDGARNCFSSIYRYIFEHAALLCTQFDAEYGHRYQHAANASGETKAYVDGFPKFPSSIGVLYFRQETGRDVEHPILISNVPNSKVLGLMQEYGCQNFDEAFQVLKKILRPDMEKVNAYDDTQFWLKLGRQRFRLGKKGNDANCGDLPENIIFRIEEHTAQISNAKGQLYQRLFSEGKINVLSCSTTFEMGVDLGALNCIFLCNLPPTVANYTQRAGRAGRRAGSASYVLTCIGNSSHDAYYAAHPDELFFGRTETPMLYLDNVTYRSKHLRAVALHDFLKYVKQKGNDLAGWEKSGIFFKGYEAKRNRETQKLQRLEKERYDQERYPIVHLHSWLKVNKGADAPLQKVCEEISGCKLPYIVAADLFYQLKGGDEEGLVKRLLNDYSDDKLSGPNNGTELSRPLLKEYESMFLQFGNQCFQNITEAGSVQAAHLISRQTVEYLSQRHVLPLYGFPCDVVELVTDSEDVSLTRNKKQAIYEYAPCKEITANKKIYKSIDLVFYMDRTLPHATKLAETSYALQVFRCPDCRTFHIYKKDKPECPCCGSKSVTPGWFCSPDGFRAGKGKPCTEEVGRGKTYRAVIYESGVSKDDPRMEFGNTIVIKPSQRTLFYLNTKLEKPWEDNQDSDTETRKYVGLYHRIQTDIVIIRSTDTSLNEIHTAKYEDDAALANEANRAAWESAAQAYARAAAMILGVREGDISAFSQRDNEGYCIVLYDDTSNGSGVLLNLMPLGEAALKLHRRILEKAGELCRCERCMTSDEKAECLPILHAKYLSKIESNNQDGYREYTSCYCCLRTYKNQLHHAHLDTHDAAVIIRGLLGGSEELPESEVSKISEARSSEARSRLMRDSQLIMDKKLEETCLSEDFLQKILDNQIARGTDFFIQEGGTRKKARYIDRDTDGKIVVKIDGRQRLFTAGEIKKIIKED